MEGGGRQGKPPDPWSKLTGQASKKGEFQLHPETLLQSNLGKKSNINSKSPHMPYLAYTHASRCIYHTHTHTK